MKDWIMAGIVCLVMVTAKAYAEPPWQHQHDQPFYLIQENYYVPPHEEPAEDAVNVTEVVNTTNIENYTPDYCQGVAIAQAGTNNQMYMGTRKPQLSVGLGECGGDLASSLMFGVGVSNNLMINGSWATDNEVNAFGVGATVIFK